MTKITGVVTDLQPISKDSTGYDSAITDPVKLKSDITEFAIRCMPEVVRKCFYIVQNSKSNKDIIQAAKFIKSVADGQTPKGKTVNGIVKKLSDAELSKQLQSQVEHDED